MDTIAVILNNKARNHSAATPYLQGLHNADIAFNLYDTTPEDLSETIKGCIKTYKVILVGGEMGQYELLHIIVPILPSFWECFL